MVSLNKNKRKKEQTETRNNFYLSFFDNKNEYQEKEVNGFWLVKQYNPETKQTQASLYSQESYKRYKTLENTA